MAGLRRRCSICPEDAVVVRGRVALCARHGELAGEVLVELRNAGARALGAVAEQKMPTLFALAKTAWITMQTANRRPGDSA